VDARQMEWINACGGARAPTDSTSSTPSCCHRTAHEHRAIFSAGGMRTNLRRRTQGFLTRSNACGANGRGSFVAAQLSARVRGA
jgi:hypothetical protein